MRDVTIAININDTRERIGGINENGDKKIIEIEKSTFFKCEYNGGKPVNEQWFIGSMERGPRNCFIVQIPNRRAVTIFLILGGFILPGATIISDCWRTHNREVSDTELDLEHRTIYRCLNFVARRSFHSN